MLEKKIVIWGTGKYAKSFMSTLIEYNRYAEVFDISLLNNIEVFVVSNIGEETLFYGKPVVSIKKTVFHGAKICVVAVFDSSSIINELEKYNIDILGCDQYLEVIRDQLVRVICNKTPSRVCADSILSSIKMIKALNNNEGSNVRKTIEELRKKYNLCDIIDSAKLLFGNRIEMLSREFSTLEIRPPKIETIGIMADRFFGGGIEKVLELLIRIFLENGLKVVLLLDERKEGIDFRIPNNCVIHVMNNKHSTNCTKRLWEIGDCIDTYKIDLVCYHFGYSRLSTFYEMLYLKIRQIPVLIEVHSGFMGVLNQKKDIAKHIPSMYKLADKVIVLSKTDKLFWENLGINSKYIQNPVEKKEAIKRKGCNGVILWVGRIVQLPKQVWDVVDIIDNVKKALPNVKCIIAGAIDRRYDYDRLVELIEEKNLNNNIKINGFSSNIENLYRCADVVLMTSSNESYSNVIQESKIYGLPLVTYELPWLELLKDKRGYISVQQKDTKGAACAIIDVLTKDELREKLRNEARKTIEPFINKDVWSDWKETFDEILKPKHSKSKIDNEMQSIQLQMMRELFDYYD